MSLAPTVLRGIKGKRETYGPEHYLFPRYRTINWSAFSCIELVIELDIVFVLKPTKNGLRAVGIDMRGVISVFL